MCFATLALTSCSAIQSAASSDTVASATGQSCGTAVQGLYSAYKRTGTIDLTNTTNLKYWRADSVAACLGSKPLPRYSR